MFVNSDANVNATISIYKLKRVKKNSDNVRVKR
jgi:hypothetical protein